MSNYYQQEQDYYTQIKNTESRGYAGQQEELAQARPYAAPQQQQWQMPPQASTDYNNQQNEANNTLAGLSYIGFWLTGLLVLLFVRKNRLARFHAMQSVLFFGTVTIMYFVFINIMIAHTPFIFGFAIFGFVVMNIVAVVAWIVGMTAGFSGRFTKLPFVGDIVEGILNENQGTVK